MRYFITKDGLVPITVSDKKLFYMLYNPTNRKGVTKPSEREFEDFINEIDSEAILFKHPDYDLNDLCYLCATPDVGDILVDNLKRDLILAAEADFVVIALSITCYPLLSFFVDTLCVSTSNVASLFRRKIIDDFLNDNK